MADKLKYTFSFTGATALIAETLIVAEEFERVKTWQAAHDSILQSNLLSKVKEATFKREFREIKKRLSKLTSEQLSILVRGDLDEAKAIIFLSLVKTYPFFRDFVVEVLRNKYLSYDFVLTEVDYMRFFNSKSISRIELSKLSESTTEKVKQRIFTMLAQTGMISRVDEGMIIKPILSRDVLVAIVNEDPTLLSTYLFSNDEIKMHFQKLKHA